MIKIQVRVSAELADELAYWANEVEYTQARFCRSLISLAVEDPGGFAKWLHWRITARAPIKPKIGWLQRGESSGAKLQIPLPQDVIDEIANLASRLDRTMVGMAAFLLDFSLYVQQTNLKLLRMPIGKKVAKKLGRISEAYESAEVDNEEDTK